MKENRKRSETLTIRLTRSEKARLISKAQRAKMSVTDYLVAVSERTEIHLPPDTVPVVTELKRIGNNLNQIAAKVNSGVTYVGNLAEVIENQNRAYRLLYEFTERCRWRQ